MKISPTDLQLQQKLTFEIDDWIEQFCCALDAAVCGCKLKYDGYENPFRINGRTFEVYQDGNNYSFPLWYLQDEPEVAAERALNDYLVEKKKQVEEKKARELIRLQEQVVAREREIEDLRKWMASIKIT